MRRRATLFDNQDLVDVRRVHRWAVFFGVVTPLVLLLCTLLRTRELFGVWPTVLQNALEHAFYYGWAGMYMLGILSYLMPQVMDQNIEDRDRRRLSAAFILFGVGLAMITVQALARSMAWPLLRHEGFGVLGAIGEAAALIIWLNQVSTWIMRGRNAVPILQSIRLIGLWLFTAGALLNVVIHTGRLFGFSAFNGIGTQAMMRLLPVAGVGLVTFGVLLRMVPELLGWRPLEDQRIKQICSVLVVGGIISTFAEPLFDAAPGTLSGLVFIASTAITFAGVAWLLISLDMWHVRLAPLVNREHLPFVFGSLGWLLLSTGMYLVMAFAEVSRNAAYEIWDESILFAYMGGFVASGLLAIYTYWVNQEPGAYQHNDRLATIAFVFLQWVLVLRVFVYPLTVITAWEGTFAFRWILDAFFMIGIALMAIDTYDGLMGHYWRVPWRGKKRQI